MTKDKKVTSFLTPLKGNMVRELECEDYGSVVTLSRF